MDMVNPVLGDVVAHFLLHFRAQNVAFGDIVSVVRFALLGPSGEAKFRQLFQHHCLTGPCLNAHGGRLAFRLD